MDIIDELKTDHANFLRLLKIMSEEITEFEAGGSADLARMLDIMDYIQTYPDFVHHPKEDILYRAYLECHEEGHEVIGQMLEEHVKLKDRTIEIKHCLEGIFHDAVIDREPLCRELGDFVALQTRHIQTEERRVFGLLRSGLEEADLLRLAQAFPARMDPIFGGQVENRYRGLLRRLLWP